MVTLRRQLVRFLRLPGIRPIATVLLGAALRLSIGRRTEKGITVMQVGARGGADPYTKWLRIQRRIETTIGVEPESSGVVTLKATRGYDHIITQGLSDAPGTASLFITKAKGWCSLLKPDEKAIERIATNKCIQKRPYEIIGTEQVELTTFDNIKGTVPSIDFLQIDVQGAELNVLKGATKALRDIAVVELEVRFYAIYEHEPLFPDVHAFLEQHGFVLFEMRQQGETEFGDKYVEANACYYNSSIAREQPERMEMLRTYARSKHALYGNKVLSLLGDVQSE
jgi:FkbM family methyltransferase